MYYDYSYYTDVSEVYQVLYVNKIEKKAYARVYWGKKEGWRMEEKGRGAKRSGLKYRKLARVTAIQKVFSAAGYDTFNTIYSRWTTLGICFILCRRVQNLQRKYEGEEQRGWEIYANARMQLSRVRNRFPLLRRFLLTEAQYQKWSLKNGEKYDLETDNYLRVSQWTEEDLRDIDARVRTTYKSLSDSAVDTICDTPFDTLQKQYIDKCKEVRQIKDKLEEEYGALYTDKDWND